MKTFEYTTFQVQSEFVSRHYFNNDLNRLGKDGWELVGVGAYGSPVPQQILYFKREIVETGLG